MSGPDKALDSNSTLERRRTGARGGDGLVAANGPDVQTLEQELQLAREIVFDLRNPVGAVRMAVQMLHGPLHKLLQRLDARDRVTVESVLSALDSSTQELCQTVARLQPYSGAPPLSRRRAPTPVPLVAVPTQKQAPSVPAPAPPRTGRATRPERPERPPVAAVPDTRAPLPPPDGNVDVGALLSRLEMMVVTRSSLPAMLAVNAGGPLWVKVPGPDLLRSLGYLVENALEAASEADPKGAPWTVEVRAFSDLREVLGDELDVVIEIMDKGGGLPASVRQWCAAPLTETLPASKKEGGAARNRGLFFVRSLVEGCGGVLDVRRARDHTVVAIRLPCQSAR